jgi:hypothetical protein
MNIGDFPSEAGKAAAEAGVRGRGPLTVRRAFRYQQAEQVSVAIHTERVLPEIRVTESGTVSVADERIVLATKLNLRISKAGIFSVELGMPPGFDVETLSGADVSHWDETSSDPSEIEGPPRPRSVVVHFSRQVTESTEIDLVVAQMEKGIEERITVPRVTVREARKHGGRLTVSGERGVRMLIESHRGVDIKKASEEGIKQAGVLVFDILRPTWSMVLKTEILEPVVKPGVLQWVDLAEGMLQCRAFIRYQIENAGVKTFLLRSPVPGVTLSVTGRHIARVHEVDKEKGLWRVDLHRKVERLLPMNVSYQVPYDPATQRVTIKPLGTADTEGQRGYLVVTCAGRVQVEPTGEPAGLKVEDPRNIPSEFGAGDLSNAIRCYRTVRPDYELGLSVVRHESADVLPASIRQVRMTSVLSTSGKILTRVLMQMTVGHLRFLKAELPHPDDTLWTVLVNGREVPISRDGLLYCIPLEEQEGNQVVSVDLVYAGSSLGGWLGNRREMKAPKFGLPMNDIKWTVFAVPGANYYGLGGTLTPVTEDGTEVRVFDAAQYLEYNRRERERSLQKARQVLDTGNALVREGRQRHAKKAFQQALNYSQGQADLNEDARVQLRKLTKQQVKLGLVNRRGAIRQSHNIVEEGQAAQMEGFRDGDFTQEYVSRIERSLSERDNDALELVADKIIDQQTAAAGLVRAISITMPAHGQPLHFARALQIDPDGDLTVAFMAAGEGATGLVNRLWPPVFLFALLWAAMRRWGGLRPVKAA